MTPSPEHLDLPNGKETVLVVEDDGIVQRIAHRILCDCGYQVIMAPGADEALSLCRRHIGSIHLALIDIVTPKAFGRELAGWLRRLHPGLKVLFMSGYPGFEIIEKNLLSPSDPYLPKPFAADTLARKVREVLDGVSAA